MEQKQSIFYTHCHRWDDIYFWYGQVKRPVAPSRLVHWLFPMFCALCLDLSVLLSSGWQCLMPGPESVRVWGDGRYRSQTPRSEGRANGWTPLLFDLPGRLIALCVNINIIMSPSFSSNNQQHEVCYQSNVPLTETVYNIRVQWMIDQCFGVKKWNYLLNLKLD